MLVSFLSHLNFFILYIFYIQMSLFFSIFMFLLIYNTVSTSACRYHCQATKQTFRGQQPNVTDLATCGTNETELEELPILEDIHNHLPYHKCSHTVLTSKMNVNPFREIKNQVAPKGYSSVCIKCAACLAVAEKYEEAVKVLSKSLTEDGDKSYSYNEIGEIFYTSLSKVCNNDFKNYDLRENNGIQYYTDNFDNSTHVSSPMDGKWADKLKDTCLIFLEYADFPFLFYSHTNSSAENVINIKEYLCDGAGIFKDCANIESGQCYLGKEDGNSNFLKCENHAVIGGNKANIF